MTDAMTCPLAMARLITEPFTEQTKTVCDKRWTGASVDGLPDTPGLSDGFRRRGYPYEDWRRPLFSTGSPQ